MIQRDKTKLGALALRAFSWIQHSGKDVVKTGEIMKALKITAQQERYLLSRMSRSGLLVRLMRGVYLAPDKIPPNIKWMPNEYVIVVKLMEELKAQYAICGPTAFNYYGLIEQIPIGMSIYNSRISGAKKIAGLVFDFIKVDPQRIGNTSIINPYNDIEVNITNYARTLFDAVYDWSRFNAIPQAYRWIITAIKNDTGLTDQMVEICRKYGNKGTNRRIGYILEIAGASEDDLDKINGMIPKTKAYIPLVPGTTLKGEINKNWGLIINWNVKS